MKKFISLLILLCCASVNAQITLEHTFPGNNIDFYNRFIYTDIGENDFKYILVNYSTSTFDIYNLDYSPYQLNIQTALPLDQYDIAYISKTLFDCDSATIEYAMMNDSSVKVYRLDETQLFSRENVVAPYCIGCNNGSNLLTPIVNTPNGTKMILQDNITHATYMYSLCGTLSVATVEITNENSVTVFPVPAQNGRINFKVTVPDSITNAQLEIFNVNMQQLDAMPVSGRETIISKQFDFTAGMYFYVLKSSGKVVKTGRFIIK